MKTLPELFKMENDVQAPSGLESRVLASVAGAAKAQDKKDRIVWGSFSVGSLGFFIWSVVYAVDAFKHSAFGSYFSLIFSDLGSVSHFWRQLGTALLESLPITAVVLVLAGSVFVLWSVRKYSRRPKTFITNTYARVA